MEETKRSPKIKMTPAKNMKNSHKKKKHEKRHETKSQTH